MAAEEQVIDEVVFRPELLSRRGESIGWISATMVFIGWGILKLSDKQVPTAAPFLGIFLLLAACAMSFGNWMDRNTLLKINPEGLKFTNGLRRVDIHWGVISQIQVFPSKWGKKIRVIGGKTHFYFRSLAEVKIQGEVKGRMGFKDGDKILQVLLDRTQLKQSKYSDSCYYYERE